MTWFAVFDRWGKQVGSLPEVIEAVHKDEVNGEDSLTLMLPECRLSKGQRIVWRDEWGEFHEHTVSKVTDVHAGGELYAAVYCENSIAELFTDYIEDLRPYKTTAYQALQKALSPSRWAVGTVDVLGTSSASFYHISSREAVAEVVANWGGEWSVSIAVSGCEVASRAVNLLARRGADNGKRFEWSKDIESIEREVSQDDVCTALYGYGKGVETYDEDGSATGGFSRKITFGSINGGRDWVGDEDARLRWGVPDGHGGVKHAFGKVEFDECEDPAELKRLTEEELERRKVPQVTYSANVVSLADAGLEWEDCRTGDTVAIVDRELGERLSGRVLCVERYLFCEGATSLTLGNIAPTIGSVLSGQAADLKWLRDRAAGWDGAAGLSESYINAVIASLNNTMNETGGYTYYKPGEGITTYDRPEDQNPTMAIQIKGAGFRIASSKKSNGEWNWRTFGTGAGFTADLITAGKIVGGANAWNLSTGDLQFKQGGITAENGSHWNLDSGEFQTVFVLNANAGSYRGTNYTRYTESVIAVEMSETTAFGIYKGTRYRYAYDDGNVTYSAVTGKSFVGGLTVNGSSVYLRASRAGTSDALYITTGTTQGGNPGASFVNSYGNYCDIESLKAVDDTSGRTTGVGMACFDKPFIQASTYYNQVWLYPPIYSQTYLQQPPTQLYLKNGTRALLQMNDTNAIDMSGGVLEEKASGYISLKAPRMAVGTVPGGVGTYAVTGTYPIVTSITAKSGGGIEWTYGSVNITNGVITSWPK